MQAMDRADMSAPQLAERIFCERKSIYAYCYGYTAPDAVRLARICKVLHVSADWLLFGKGEPHEEDNQG